MSNSPEQKIVHALSEFADALKDGDLSKYRQTVMVRHDNGSFERVMGYDELRKEWDCWQLLNGGEGPRGEHVVARWPERCDTSPRRRCNQVPRQVWSL